MSGSFFDPPQIADVLFLKGFTNHTGDGRASVTFKGLPKATYGMAIYLGQYVAGGDPKGLGAGTEERLNALGWVYDPKRAAPEMNSRLDGTYKEPEE